MAKAPGATRRTAAAATPMPFPKPATSADYCIILVPKGSLFMHNGSCLCGAVTFEIKGELKAPDACHCSQCRKQSGHYWASTNVPRNALALKGADKLTWYQSSEKVRRGFCSVCGA